MPSKKGARRKPVPVILRTPIEHSELEEEKATSLAISRQIEIRLSAVFEYYGVDRHTPSGAIELIELMARERFRAGFRRVLKENAQNEETQMDVFAKDPSH